MDGKTFDSLLKLTATRAGRRRLLQATAAAGISALLTRRPEVAAQVEALACQDAGTQCTRNRQCQCKSPAFANRQCGRLSGKCRSGNRCCGTAKAICNRDCDCCRGYTCNTRRNVCQ
jgi:hypothetical protein